jgi:hypothetical protein
MTRPSRTRVVVALSLLLVAAGVGLTGASAMSERTVDAPTAERAGAPAAVGSGGPGDEPNGGRAAPITRCLSGDGGPASIGGGGGGAAMETVIHLSVLTDPAAGNEFGVESAGLLDGEPIVVLAAGVRLTARQAITDGVDPFAAFDVLYTYELRLPMFDGAVGDADYEDDGSPIDSGAGAVDC